MVVKTFRGQLASGTQEKIPLSTIKGKVGYRITKLELMGRKPGATSQECVVKVYKQEQSVIDGIVNFSDNTGLAAAIWFSKSTIDYPVSKQVIFDVEIFNQDIYVTHIDLEDALPCNYYIELELMDLSDYSAEYTTLKEIKNAK